MELANFKWNAAIANVISYPGAFPSFALKKACGNAVHVGRNTAVQKMQIGAVDTTVTLKTSVNVD